jgi:myo-inositol 2-dehydrogenase / D-chiro-inositol 1-dehydrogenase
VPGRRLLYGPADHNGYEGEWRELGRDAAGASPGTSAADLIDDLAFALTIADLAAQSARSETIKATAA